MVVAMSGCYGGRWWKRVKYGGVGYIEVIVQHLLGLGLGQQLVDERPAGGLRLVGRARRGRGGSCRLLRFRRGPAAAAAATLRCARAEGRVFEQGAIVRSRRDRGGA